MGDIKGFLKVKRQKIVYRPVCQRLKDYKEVVSPRASEQTKEQTSRCMDCGTPFCHWGCPVGNLIPEWNDHVFHTRWEKAYRMLSVTNNFPEITGRLCPALCEYSCVLGINDDPVTIRENELDVIEEAFKKGWVKPVVMLKNSGKKIAVVGSGPAGLACADQLAKAGHKITVFERDKKAGGILRYGIPGFKLEKWIIDRRIELMKKSGVKFKTGVCIGKGHSFKQLFNEFDAISLACGSTVPRDLDIEGRGLKGIYFAMDYLKQSNLRQEGERFLLHELIDAKAKKVVVIGGGDTGADCVGTAIRQGAACVIQIEIMPQAPVDRPVTTPWPKYPALLKVSSSHEEGCQRKWQILTKKFIGEDSRVKKLICAEIDLDKKEIPGSEFELEADLVILALGFLHPEHQGLVKEACLKQDSRGNIETDNVYLTSCKKVFACGDMRRGQSLIVWAIAEGRRAAYHIDRYLRGKSSLPVI